MTSVCHYTETCIGEELNVLWIVVEASQIPPEMMREVEIPKGMDPAKAEEMKQKFQQAHKEAPTIAFPIKYKSSSTTDLKCTITQGKQESLNLELKD